MSSYPPRGQAPNGAPAYNPAPHAALLIDFDNVTMGVRSDLGKELKTLLNSTVFQSKVAVRRAYADWRRYPNYVVPLSESSIDLIFAPAYGTSKKNATDLRMAVDAIELAFMRPEIGTFILLTGDSDFTSCVVKLKEYGKYVIGVGMRESSSDLLIQNCDEYYSYHALSGLARVGSNEGMKEDPWLLVGKAARQMARNRDAMRTDRLKQVMIDLDPGFDEKALGYAKFSKFASDAAQKGLIRLRRVENGQYEVVVEDDGGDEPRADEIQADYRDGERDGERDRGGERDRDRERGRGRGRGRFGRDRERGPRPEGTLPMPSPIVADEAPETQDAPDFAAAAETHYEPAAYEPAVQTPEHAEAEAPSFDGGRGPEGSGTEADRLQAAYGLLQHAVRGMVGGKIGQTVRDGDVKRRMLDIAPGFDEGELGFSKFSRFLRQAHDAEVIDLRRLGEGSYEVALPASGTKLPAPAAQPGAARTEQMHPSGDGEQGAQEPQAEGSRGGRRGRGRGRGRGGDDAPRILPGQAFGASSDDGADAEAPAEAPAREEAAARAEAPARTEAPAREETPRVETSRAAETAVAADSGAAARPTGMAGRSGKRGDRGNRFGGGDGPPPLLPGQAIPSSRVAAAEAAPQQPETQPQAEAPAAEAPAATEAAPAEEAPRGRGRGRGRGGRSAAPVAEPAAPAGFDAGRLGLPTDRGEIETYITTAYRGIGRKTAESLTQAFGNDVFAALQEDPDSVRKLMGRRADALIGQWAEDYDRRSADAGAAAATEASAAESAPAETPQSEAPSAEAAQAEASTEAAPAAAEEPAASDDAEATPEQAPDSDEGEGPRRSRSRGRRGGRGRGRGGDVPAGEAEPIEAPVAAPVVAEPEPEAAPAAEAETAEAPGTDEGGEAGDAGEGARRSRGRRGGRGRGRKAGADEGPVAEPVAEAPVEAPAPEPTPEPTPEAAPAAEEKPAPRRRSRAAPKAEAAPAPEPEPAPAPAPEAVAETGEGDDGRPRRRSRSRGKGKKGDTPAPE
ncbi:MAG TPA: NYN domain-containing protein [Longimicrobiaceae bacterium]|jgi:hypothetical protein|nr:NYN domain-containing protein [Longimicrobiaceae bacterium]